MNFCRNLPGGKVFGSGAQPVPNGFWIDSEHLCRFKPSHFASIRTLLLRVAQSVKLLTELVRGAPSGSGHLAQHERQVWVFIPWQADPYIVLKNPTPSGRQAIPTYSPPPSPPPPSPSPSRTAARRYCPCFMCVVCVLFLLRPGYMPPLGNVEKKKKIPPSSRFSPPGGVHSQKRNISPLSGFLPRGVCIHKKEKSPLFRVFSPGVCAFTKKKNPPSFRFSPPGGVHSQERNIPPLSGFLPRRVCIHEKKKSPPRG